MNINFSNIEAITFDIGNVLIDISYEQSVRKFQALSDHDFQKILGYTHQFELFNMYERGEISTGVFISDLTKHLRSDVSDQQIIEAWNSMLVHYPAQKINLLNRLKKHFPLYALSNINSMHILEMNAKIKLLYGVNEFAHYFTKAIYSNEVGMRKPENRIYEHLIASTGKSPEKILFIDDKLENIEAAQKQGITCIHLTNRNDLLPIFENFG